MLRAVDTLKNAWREMYIQENAAHGTHGNGILDIRNARLIRFKENPQAPMSKYLEKKYGDPDAVAAVIEFMGYVDYFGGEDEYYDELSRTAGPSSVVLLRNGVMKAEANFLAMYSGRYYDVNFAAFIKEILDYRDRYNAVYWLLGEQKTENSSSAAEDFE